MVTRMVNLERAARIAMGDHNHGSHEPPPAGTFGPFTYFRLALLVMAIFIIGLVTLNYFSILA